MITKREWVFIVTIVFICCTVCGADSHAETIAINQVCDTNGDLTLTSVEQRSDRTIVNLQYKPRAGTTTICVFDPGDPRAFYITDVEERRRYGLLKVEEIPVCPFSRIIGYGQIFNFSLVFERVEEWEFHLLEGERQVINSYCDSSMPRRWPRHHQQRVMWNFYNVCLAEEPRH